MVGVRSHSSSCLLGFVFGVFTIPVILSVCSNLVFELGEMFDRFKDKPVLIIVLALLLKFRKV